MGAGRQRPLSGAAAFTADLRRAVSDWKWEWRSVGGELVDAGNWYAARDKAQHVAGWLGLWLCLALLPLGVWARIALCLWVGLAVEIIEGYRLARYERRILDGETPYPNFADRADAADLVADAIGMALGFIYLTLLRGAP